MVDLAVNSGTGECVSLKSIADRQGISENYLEQLIAQLKKAGLVKSIRGAQGGYTLTREPSEISVGDMLRVLEGPFTLVECVSNTESCGNAGCSKCVTKNVWERISESMNEVVDNITLQDLVSDYNKL